MSRNQQGSQKVLSEDSTGSAEFAQNPAHWPNPSKTYKVNYDSFKEEPRVEEQPKISQDASESSNLSKGQAMHRPLSSSADTGNNTRSDQFASGADARLPNIDPVLDSPSMVKSTWGALNQNQWR